MKRTLSIILSIVMLISMFGSTLVSYAAYDSVSDAYDYSLGEKVSGFIDADSNEYDYYKITVPCSGKLSIDFKFYNMTPFGISARIDMYICDDMGNIIYVNKDNAETPNLGYLYIKKTINFNKKGTYYLYFGGHYGPNGNYDLLVNFSLPELSNFKVVSQSPTSLKLSWSKASNVSGYQLQKKNDDTYKTVKNTTSTSATVKDLSSATSYKFRVRAYKKVNSKTYYGEWKYLTTTTIPEKVSIKSPSTNSKHRIIVKWNKVTRASGYQVQYCKNSSCSNVIATKTVSGGSKTSYTGKNFTKGKKYYVRVRAYKTVNDKKYYGAWSSVKSIKCK